jgi:acetylornithine deacetylase/succinyl-diaminopimelate desuccinylase-like protein
LYLIETAEKGIHWMRLTADGRAGHGSMMNGENAVTRLAEAVARIGRYEWPQRYSKTVKAFFKRIADETGKPYNEDDLRPLLSEIGFASTMIGATLQNTANPTMLEAGYKANVIPGSASAVVDGRFIPGFEDELNETIKSLIGEHVSVETITRDKALEVPFEGDLVEAMCKALIKEDSVAIPVPYVMSGGTDNKALADLGIIGYGFSPLKLDADFNFMAMFHGVDERVPVEGLTFGTRVLKEFLENA